MTLLKKFRIRKFKIQEPIANLSNISLSFDKRLILDNINLSLNSGEIIGLLGPNGAGKSTIFNLLIGLIKPDSGKIYIEGSEANNYPMYIRSRKFKIGYVPQYGGYFNDLTLMENLKAVGEILIKNTDEREIKIQNLIKQFSLDALTNVRAKFLSGGQKRKLVICMSLLGDPKILLCDEVFAALDVLTIQMLKEIFVNLQRNNPKLSIMICEHQARELLSIVDRALILSNTKIIAEGSPNNLINDKNAINEYFGKNFSK